jgi:predicted nucleic acid-binding protein
MRSDRFLDTSVLVYAHSAGDYRTDRARQFLLDGGVVSVQVLNEFASFARTKLALQWAEVQEAIESILILCPNPLPLDIETHRRGLSLSKEHGFSIGDALIVAAALGGGCGTLYSEDMQHGQMVGSVRIVNPFI